MLSEGEEISCPAAYHRGNCSKDGVNRVPGFLVDIGDHNLEDKARQRLPNVVEREGRVVVVKFETQYFLGMGVNGGILEAPEETHYVSHVNVERRNRREVNEKNGNSTHYCYKDYINYS
jgi:hypothetical protein